jgi:hypothetical protein
VPRGRDREVMREMVIGTGRDITGAIAAAEPEEP